MRLFILLSLAAILAATPALAQPGHSGQPTTGTTSGPATGQPTTMGTGGETTATKTACPCSIGVARPTLRG
jgi:hypothetical protein